MESSQHRKTFARNSAAQYVLQIAKYILPFVTLPYLTRILGTDGYAVRAYALAVMTFVQVILEFGFNLYGSKLIVDFKEDKSRVSKTVGSIMVAKILLQLFVGIVFYLVATNIPILSSHVEYSMLSYIAVCLTVLMPDFVFMAYERLGVLTTRYVVSKTVATVLTFILVKGLDDLIVVAWLDVLAALISLVLSWLSMTKNFGVKFALPRFKDVATSYRKAFPYCLSSVSGSIMSSAATVAIGIWITDPAIVSYWSLGMTVITAVNCLYTPITNALYPHMLNEFDVNLARTILLVGVPAAFLAALVGYFGAELIMLVLGGDSYVTGSYVVASLSPMLFLGFPVIVLGWPILGAAGKVREITISSVGATVLLVVGLALLVLFDSFSVVFVAVVRCLCELFMLIARIAFTHKYRLLHKGRGD